ncbi:YitT family protein [Pokkaliibacter sp. MBI-7]|uniref:YitT family protein n=1 Tax=Pokkaliibacter sp. MBI-7 TaxID=3040600 RepID=UPI002447CC42|nr:YitT family protein [Pokkaliibacter sp. MBI-7]MDH2431345.1 YitT family protein [Pokkaliibacter sp. MBI-7]
MSDVAYERHSWLEDILAIVLGTLFIALGANLYLNCGLLTGGTAGLAFLLHYLSGYSFGLVFFVINLPFYYLAIKRMGWHFTIKTFCSVALLSGWTEVLPHLIHFSDVNSVFATLFGGGLMGTGFLMLFRHKASLGGINILALYVQDRYGLRAGKLQMVVDCTVVLLSLLVVEPERIALSVLGAVMLNLVLTVNHKPGRYTGMS